VAVLRPLSLSIRATVVGAIVLGVVLPALALLLWDERVARSTHEPPVQAKRDAVAALASAAVADSLAEGRPDVIQQALSKVVRDDSVCAVEARRPDAEGATQRAARCPAGQPVAMRETAVVHDGLRVGTLRLWFDDSELDRLLSERRASVLRQVIVQVTVGIVVLLGVLSLRLLRPIDQLKATASAIATRTAPPRLAWRRRDELGQLGQHLDAVRLRIDELIAELERKNAQLRKMAMYDHLTGLPNRTLMRELFTHEAAVARRANRSMALLFIDLDRFKHVNDTLGHGAGDELLLGTSQRLLHALRASDVVCRHSGDEFVVLLREADPWDIVAATADRVLRAVEAPLPIARSGPMPLDPPREAQVSASIGIALFPRDGEDFDTLVKHADLAMYKSKQHGRSRWSFYHAKLDEQLLSRAELERELQHAIHHDELVLHYQPVVDAGSGQLRSCEALVRWQHPTRGLLLPGEFIDAAEESGLIRELGAWTIETACAQLHHWRRAGRHPGRISVNVSAVQFRDERLIETLRGSIERHRIKPGELEVELTESTLMADTEASQRTVTALREIGIPLVVDDFGTGYSSLAYLKRLRPEKLKIDRSFINDLPHDADDRALTLAILRMAQSLMIDVVAEGVETPQQRMFLEQSGCTLMQGWLSGRPLPADEFAHLLPTAAPV